MVTCWPRVPGWTSDGARAWGSLSDTRTWTHPIPTLGLGLASGALSHAQRLPTPVLDTRHSAKGTLAAKESK